MNRNGECMIKTETYCDLCGKQFTDTYWDAGPCHVVIKMSTPAQQYENHDFEHVCKACRTEFNELVLKLKSRAHESQRPTDGTPS